MAKYKVYSRLFNLEEDRYKGKAFISDGVEAKNKAEATTIARRDAKRWNNKVGLRHQTMSIPQKVVKITKRRRPQRTGIYGGYQIPQLRF